MMPLLREPLVHFIGLGALIFALFAVFDDTPPPRATDTLIVTDADARRLAAQFEATWRRAPTPNELDHLVDTYIREEVLVREALALGLDQGDAIVRQRLVQKMLFLAESGSEAIPATDDALRAHLGAHPERFERPPTIGFEQVVLRPDTTEEAALAHLAGGGEPSEIAAPSLLPDSIPPSPPRVVDATFGRGFFAALAALPLGTWSAPVESAYGLHLVRIRETSPARLPELDEIRPAVELDWRGGLRTEMVEDRIGAMIARYDVARPAPGAILAE